MSSSYTDIPYPRKHYPGPQADARDPDAARRLKVGGDMGWIIFSHLITGVALYTLLGWLLSLWVGHAPLLMGGGALLGIVLATYIIYRRLHADVEPGPAWRKTQ